MAIPCFFLKLSKKMFKTLIKCINIAKLIVNFILLSDMQETIILASVFIKLILEYSGSLFIDFDATSLTE